MSDGSPCLASKLWKTEAGLVNVSGMALAAGDIGTKLNGAILATSVLPLAINFGLSTRAFDGGIYRGCTLDSYARLSISAVVSAPRWIRSLVLIVVLICGHPFCPVVTVG